MWADEDYIKKCVPTKIIQKNVCRRRLYKKMCAAEDYVKNGTLWTLLMDRIDVLLLGRRLLLLLLKSNAKPLSYSSDDL